MVSYKDILKSLGWRAVIASVILGIGVFVMCKGLLLPDWFGAPYYIFGMAIFVTAAIIMGMPLARLIAEFLGNLIYTSAHYKKPQPVYGIPESKRLKGLVQESFEDYQKLSEEHPQELKAHIAMIDIALVEMKNPDLAGSVYSRGMDTLDKEEAREALSRKYKELTAGN